MCWSMLLTLLMSKFYHKYFSLGLLLPAMNQIECASNKKAKIRWKPCLTPDKKKRGLHLQNMRRNQHFCGLKSLIVNRVLFMYSLVEYHSIIASKCYFKAWWSLIKIETIQKISLWQMTDFYKVQSFDEFSSVNSDLSLKHFELKRLWSVVIKFSLIWSVMLELLYSKHLTGMNRGFLVSFRFEFCINVFNCFPPIFYFMAFQKQHKKKIKEMTNLLRKITNISNALRSFYKTTKQKGFYGRFLVKFFKWILYSRLVRSSVCKTFLKRSFNKMVSFFFSTCCFAIKHILTTQFIQWLKMKEIDFIARHKISITKSLTQKFFK